MTVGNQGVMPWLKVIATNFRQRVCNQMVDSILVYCDIQNKLISIIPRKTFPKKSNKGH